MAVNVLLRLSSRGEALVAELLRLSDHIPPLFSLLEKQEQKTYGEVLLDFCYLKTPALYEHRIENSAELISRDSEVWEVHGALICRVYDLFESVYKFLKDFVRCVSDLREGVYIQQTIEGVLLDEDGKQLMCEVLYLYGVLLLLMDAKIEGPVRERIVDALRVDAAPRRHLSIRRDMVVDTFHGSRHEVTDRHRRATLLRRM